MSPIRKDTFLYYTIPDYQLSEQTLRFNRDGWVVVNARYEKPGYLVMRCVYVGLKALELGVSNES